MQFNEKEVEALAQFRTKIGGLIDDADDYFLIRWLRARDLDMDKAQEMVLNYFDWLKANKNLPVIAHWAPPREIFDELHYRFLGNDHSGRPVILVSSRKWDLKRLIEQGFKEDIYRYAYKIMDEIVASIDQAGVGQCVGLVDMSEFSWRQISIETIQVAFEFLQTIEMFYPELLHSNYVINAPYAISAAYNLLKPALSAKTMSKIQIFDSDSSKWGPILLKDLPVDIVPVQYGGTLQLPDLH